METLPLGFLSLLVCTAPSRKRRQQADGEAHRERESEVGGWVGGGAGILPDTRSSATYGGGANRKVSRELTSTFRTPHSYWP